jgi:SAM-dependent methyltransferase
MTYSRDLDGECLHRLDDEAFDGIYPAEIQGLSRRQWTPVEVCRTAAHMLAPHPDFRVLDVGCGPGKFCAVGAAATGAHFTGVEQREGLARIAKHLVRRFKLTRVEILHANIMDIGFGGYDSVYLFNPFQENLLNEAQRIDFAVPLLPALYQEYNAYVKGELEKMPPGTRVVTYWGEAEEIPASYVCVETAFEGRLMLWIKR